MKCSETQDLLSALHDGQVSNVVRAQLDQHLQSCEDCRSVFASYEALSAVAQRLSDAEPPANLWSRIEERLDVTPPVEAAIRNPAIQRHSSSLKMFAVTASLLLAVGIALTSLLRDAHDHNELAVDFDHYLDVYAEDPAEAARDLFAEYPAEEVGIDEATRLIGYRPVIANALPAGYSVDSIHLMKMPCCTCIKTLCSDDQGQPFVIFEHDDEQTVWFGDRKKQHRECGGMPTTIIEFDGQIAATWAVGKRSVTIVGAKNIDEVERLMPYLGKEPEES